MKIIINYDSIWKNSFLDGSNNEPLPKNGRKFIASSKSLEKDENYIKRKITIDTVMGILNRLIGDQRKLYQSRKDNKYFFKDIKITFKNTFIKNKDSTFIRNMTGKDPNFFSGMIDVNDNIFISNYSDKLWGILDLTFEELCDFIINDNIKKTLKVDPFSIIEKFKILGKLKKVENKNNVTKALKILDIHFPGTNYYAKNKVIPSTMYCSALYLQVQRLSKKYNMDGVLRKGGSFGGISKRLFTKNDWLNRFSTGKIKKVWGNPYIKKFYIKGEGLTVEKLTKAYGNLEIIINVNKTKAKEIKKMIENAGTGCFTVGKKGLAYIYKITL